jgi:chromate transporter
VPGFTEALRYWLILGAISFGGPAGQIAMMQQELVERRRWIDQPTFLQALNFCMLLPGPEAQQLATYLGWRLHGVVGGLVAGILFVAPGAVLMLGLAWVAAAHGDSRLVAAIFDGVKPVVVAIVAHAVWRIGRKSFKHWAAVAVAAGAFVALRFAQVPFPLVILGAGLIGWATSAAGVAVFAPVKGAAAIATPRPPPPWRPVLWFLALWTAPVALVLATLGTAPFAAVIELFTIAAFVTFGGAYAVLPFIAEAAVGAGWLSAAEMVNGLALAESTPGPLILVNGYVGFFAGWQDGAGGLGRALVGGALAVYLTFLPSFLFIFAGAPWIERLNAAPRIAAALGAITAAVVGVILNLTVFFTLAVWTETAVDARPLSVAVALAALGLLIAGRGSVPLLVSAGAAIGLARVFLG